MAPKSKSGKAYAAKMKAKHAARRKKIASASVGKKKLGETSLGWIANTSESEAILSEGESPQAKSPGVSKETKIGLAKQYAAGKGGKKEETNGKPTSGLSAGNSTITKGKKLMQAEKEVITAEEVGKNLGETKVTALAEGTEKPEVAEAKETEVVEEAAPAAGEPVAAAEGEKAPVEEKEKAEAVEKAAVAAEEALHIPDDSSTIVKKKGVAASRKEIKARKIKAPPVKKEAAIPAAATAEEVPSLGKKLWREISVVGGSLKKESLKVSGAIAKPFKSDKIGFREWGGPVADAAKHPVETLAAMDSKVTRSMKKLVSVDGPGGSGKSMLRNIKAADNQITKSAKKLIDSIIK